MPLFRRNRADDAGADEPTADDVAGGELSADEPSADEPGAGEAAGGEPAPVDARPAGPWDVADVHDEVQRLDLGALLVPAPEGCEIRLDVQDEQVVAATVVDGRSAIQIHAFAAPKRTGIWTEVRAEIAQSLRDAGGSAEEVDGPWGPELRARIPAEGQGQGALQPARFLGVDGPRWFLRGLVTGAAATDPQQARVLEQAFRDVVVVRGSDAMAPRDLLPLRLPREAVAQPADGADEEGQQRPTLDMLERGPEITETR